MRTARGARGRRRARRWRSVARRLIARRPSRPQRRRSPAAGPATTSGQDVTIEGRVTAIHESPLATVIAFGQNFAGFTATILAADRDKFPSDLDARIRDRVVRVSGTVTTYRGKPEMALRDPAQLVAGAAAGTGLGRRAHAPRRCPPRPPIGRCSTRCAAPSTASRLASRRSRAGSRPSSRPRHLDARRRAGHRGSRTRERSGPQEVEHERVHARRILLVEEVARAGHDLDPRARAGRRPSIPRRARRPCSRRRRRAASGPAPRSARASSVPGASRARDRWQRRDQHRAVVPERRLCDAGLAERLLERRHLLGRDSASPATSRATAAR